MDVGRQNGKLSNAKLWVLIKFPDYILHVSRSFPASLVKLHKTRLCLPELAQSNQFLQSHLYPSIVFLKSTLDVNDIYF